MSAHTKSATSLAEEKPSEQRVGGALESNATTVTNSKTDIEVYEEKDLEKIEEVQPLPEWWLAKYLPVSLFSIFSILGAEFLCDCFSRAIRRIECSSLRKRRHTIGPSIFLPALPFSSMDMTKGTRSNLHFLSQVT